MAGVLSKEKTKRILLDALTLDFIPISKLLPEHNLTQDNAFYQQDPHRKICSRLQTPGSGSEWSWGYQKIGERVGDTDVVAEAGSLLSRGLS